MMKQIDVFEVSLIYESNYPIHISLSIDNHRTQFMTLTIDQAQMLANILSKNDKTSISLFTQQGQRYEIVWNSSLMVNFEYPPWPIYSFKLHRVIAAQLSMEIYAITRIGV